MGMPTAGIPSFCTRKDLDDPTSGITIAEIAKYHVAIEEMVKERDG